ncbi:MAG: aminotransferase class IV [Chthoniobacterales bacterium]
MQCAAQSAARAAGFDHALLADRDGNLLSGAVGNVFFVYDGQLCTPSSGLSVRPGVMRDWVMAQENVQEVRFKALDLEKVAEIFLTNSRLGVMPLQFGRLTPGTLGCALRDRCRREKIIP